MDKDNFIKDYINAFTNSSYGKMEQEKEQRLDIAIRKSKYEETLDKMWSNYIKGFTSQIVEYEKQKDIIKNCGCKVFRNSKGQHKIVIP